MNFTRRTALKAIAGVLMAPTVTLRKTVDREAILRAFCDDIESIRYGERLMAPIVHGDHVWATNARELIRAVDYGFERDGGEGRVPNLHQCFDTLYRPGKFSDFRLPRIEDLAHRPDVAHGIGVCPLCDDRRVSYGEFYPTDQETANNLPCYDPDDNTIRDKSCPLCRGKDYTGPSVLLIHGVPFSYSRVKKLALVPNCRVAINHDGPSSHGRSEILCFEGDGFSGVAMPIVGAEKV